MAEKVTGVTWEAPAHHHIEKGTDWFWALGVIAVAGTAAAFIFGNALFGVVILLGAATMVIVGMHRPPILPFAVLTRGIRVGNELYPYATLESFHIDEEHPRGPHLLIKSKKLFMPLLIMPIPDEYVDDVDDLVGSRLPSEHLEEPFSHRILEFFGF